MIWSLIWGALLGGIGSYLDWVSGAVMGALIGWSLHQSVRALVRSELQAAAHKGCAPRQEKAVDQPAKTDIGADGDAFWRNTSFDAALPAPEPDDALAQAQASSAVTPAASTTLPTPAIPEPLSTPAAVHKPHAPSLLAHASTAARNWLLGGNTIVRLGLVILFIGLSFLLRAVAAVGLFPIELRLAAVGVVGSVLLALGFRQRLARPGFGLALQGAGLATLYLTLFGAFRLYELLPQTAALALMVAVCAGGCALALLQHSQALAFTGLAGGFAAPVLLSTGGGSHVALFSYYTLLNLAILFIATRRSWRALNLLGFTATFGVATLWGVLNYTPANYATAQFFLLVFMAIFIATVVLYARQTPTQLGHAVDSTLVFGTPLVSFGLQVGLVQSFDFGAAFSALGFGAVYLGLAVALARQRLASWRLLLECFIALGVGFVTLAVPLALDAQWSSGVWALEGAAAFWVGARQARWMPRAFGLALQALALLAFINGLQIPPAGHWPLAHQAFMGAMLLALPALGCAWLARQALPHSGSRWAAAWVNTERLLPSPLFLYGFFLWCVAWALELTRHTPSAVTGQLPQPVLAPAVAQLLVMLALLLSAAAALWIARRTRWHVAAWPSRAALPFMAAVLLGQWAQYDARVLDGVGLLVWPLALSLHGWMLWLSEQDASASPAARDWLAWLHPAGVWLKAALLTDVGWTLIDRASLWGTAWASVIGLVAGTAMLVALTRWAGPAARAGAGAADALHWPLRKHALGYLWTAALPVVVLTLLSALGVAWTSPGHSAPLPYIPLLNPTDLSVALALGATLLWRRAVLAATPRPASANALAQPAFWGVMGMLALVSISTVWLRVAHHFFSVPWTAGDLFRSFVVQTGYSILWTLLALGLMLAAHRRARRAPWLTGAALLGLVVLKLLLIDLANSGGVERIVAFIGVGTLMLVVGYFVPLPPRHVPEEIARR